MRGFKGVGIIFKKNMHTKIKKSFLFGMFLAAVFSLGGVFAHGATTCEGTMSLVHGVCVPNQTGLPKGTVSGLLINLLSWLLFTFGTVSVIAFVVSGYMYLTSAGNDRMIDRAKDYMLWSIVGVIVAFSGVVIINAIASFLSGSVLF